MKQLLTLLTFIFATSCFAQGADTVDRGITKTPKTVSFVTKVDIRRATKDGIYLNGYVVNIEYEKARALDGKTIRIRGRVTIVKGIQNTDGEVSQGRQGDTKHILKPRIKIISE
jgi:hypothetical protein